MDIDLNEEIIGGILEILALVKEKIKDDSDVSRTGFNSPAEFRMSLGTSIFQLKHGDINAMQNLSHEFAPAASFESHAAANGWAREFQILSKRFYQLYKRALE